LAGLATQGSAEAYRILASQSQAQERAAKETAENTRKTSEKMDRLIDNTESLKDMGGSDSLLFAES
jgi:hypothetical protein